jgi:hypothetical protein
MIETRNFEPRWVMPFGKRLAIDDLLDLSHQLAALRRQ